MQPSAKNPDAKSQGAGGDEDLSMEEILQSIRKIIAEDGDEAKPAPTMEAAPESVPGSDVLELTDVVKEDGNVVAIDAMPPAEPAAAPAPAQPVAQPAAKAEDSGDILAKIDEALAPAKQSTVQLTEGSMLSDQAAHAAADSFKRLEAAAEPVLPPLQTTPSPAFKSGITVEDMVAAMLKPMMKEWLDKNLPSIVERIVEIEVRKLSKG